MFNFLKNIWWIFLLILAGVIIFFLGLHPNKPQNDQGVVLNDIFHQQMATPSPGSSASQPVKIADPVPPLAIVTSPVNGKESNFTIQVYSFQDKIRAQVALQALKNTGYQAFLIVTDLGPKGLWYRVRVGGIEDAAAAHKMLEDIRKNYNSGFILKP